MIYRVCCIFSQDGIKIIYKMETDQGGGGTRGYGFRPF